MKHDYTDEEIKTAWKDSPSLREFLDALPERLQAAEIAKLKAEREKWEADALRYCKNADFWRSEHDKAQAVAAVVLAQAVRRMEAVPVEEIARPYETAAQFHASECGLEAVRARLLAAAKGEGQAQPVVVNEPPKSEGQPDLSGESERQDLGAMVKAAREAAIKGLTGPAWIPHDGGPCPLKDEEVEEFEFRIRDGKVSGNVFVPSGWRWSNDGTTGDIIAYRVLRWKPGFGPEAKAEPTQAQPTTSPGWTPAVGNTVRLKSGGPVMTVIAVGVQVTCFYYTEQGVLKRGVIPAACLTPANP